MIDERERITDIPIPNECKKCIFSAFKQFQPKWIPVTERLPEKQQIVATYQKWGEYKLNHIIDGTEWYWDGVVAWMPIEPYREEADNADANGG